MPKDMDFEGSGEVEEEEEEGGFADIQRLMRVFSILKILRVIKIARHSTGIQASFSIAGSSIKIIIWQIQKYLDHNCEIFIGEYSSKPSRKSALCVYHLKSVIRKFMENIQRCFRGEGDRGLDFISPR